MSGLPVGVVDVRDMLCAQALARVAQAMAPLSVGQALAVCYNAEDVKRDTLAWANEQGHGIRDASDTTLEITRQRAGHG